MQQEAPAAVVMPRRYTTPQVQARCAAHGLPSSWTTIRHWGERGVLPAPRRCGLRVLAWDADAVDQAIARLAAGELPQSEDAHHAA